MSIKAGELQNGEQTAIAARWPTKRYQPGVAGFNYVTFNAFLGVPNIGDETSFIHGKIDRAPDGFYSPMRGLLNGNTVLFRVVVHNGADPSLHEYGVARGVRVAVALPGEPRALQTVSATIQAENGGCPVARRT